jgi:hypothetical protein
VAGSLYYEVGKKKKHMQFMKSSVLWDITPGSPFNRPFDFVSQRTELSITTAERTSNNAHL